MNTLNVVLNENEFWCIMYYLEKKVPFDCIADTLFERLKHDGVDAGFYNIDDENEEYIL